MREIRVSDLSKAYGPREASHLLIQRNRAVDNHVRFAVTAKISFTD